MADKITSSHAADSYMTQTDIVKRALATPGHSLDELLRLMRIKGQPSVYLSGSRLDNDYCFGSEDVGMLISVLPEDAQKAAVPGYHPGSAEVYVTFQGSLTMETLVEGHVKERSVSTNEIFVLPPGQCHRVRFNASQQAASLIAKTNLGHKPGVIRCDDCDYYRDKTACPLFQSWNAEK
jgi:mannose-6-phosphate isomerase-like protein (cupin superfamily)